VKRAFAVIALLVLASCGIAPQRSPLDGKPEWGGSIHEAHVKCLDANGTIAFQLDDGTIITMFFTAGSGPNGDFFPNGASGTLTIAVPSYGSDNRTYYFYGFRPDRKEK
jgi:hypothetical protein